MEIKTLPTPVSITFAPKEYWLKKSDIDWNGTYMLVHRIDMSYAGKDDQEGMPVLYMSEKEAELFRKAGFYELL